MWTCNTDKQCIVCTKPPKCHEKHKKTSTSLQLASAASKYKYIYQGLIAVCFCINTFTFVSSLLWHCVRARTMSRSLKSAGETWPLVAQSSFFFLRFFVFFLCSGGSRREESSPLNSQAGTHVHPAWECRVLEEPTGMDPPTVSPSSTLSEAYKALGHLASSRVRLCRVGSPWKYPFCD